MSYLQLLIKMFYFFRLLTEIRLRLKPTKGNFLRSEVMSGPRGSHYSSHQSAFAAESGPMSMDDNEPSFPREEIVFQILCQIEKIYNVIGESDGIVDLLQHEIGVDVRIIDPVFISDEQIIIISSEEGPDDELFPAQEALLHIQNRIVDIVPEKQNVITTRLLVPSSEIGCLKGRHGLSEIRKTSGADIQILPREELPVCVSENDELLQVWSYYIRCRCSAEEHIEKEVNGSTAPVLHPSLSNHNFSSHGSGSASEASHNSGAQYNGVEVHHTNINEDNKSKLPERANLGYPVSDGIGRLQIIKNSDLEELRELGFGTFGTVYHGNWRGSEVAIKWISNRCFAGKPSEQERMEELARGDTPKAVLCYMTDTGASEAESRVIGPEMRSAELLAAVAQLTEVEAELRDAEMDGGLYIGPPPSAVVKEN